MKDESTELLETTELIDNAKTIKLNTEVGHEEIETVLLDREKNIPFQIGKQQVDDESIDSHEDNSKKKTAASKKPEQQFHVAEPVKIEFDVPTPMTGKMTKKKKKNLETIDPDKITDAIDNDKDEEDDLIYFYRAPSLWMFLCAIIVQISCFYMINIITYINHQNGIFSVFDVKDLKTDLAIILFIVLFIYTKKGKGLIEGIVFVIEFVLFSISENKSVFLVFAMFAVTRLVLCDNKMKAKLVIPQLIILLEMIAAVFLGKFVRENVIQYRFETNINWILYGFEIISITIMSHYMIYNKEAQKKTMIKYKISNEKPGHILSETNPTYLMIIIIEVGIGFFIGGIFILINNYRGLDVTEFYEIGFIKSSLVMILAGIVFTAILNVKAYWKVDDKWVLKRRIRPINL